MTLCESLNSKGLQALEISGQTNKKSRLDSLLNGLFVRTKAKAWQ